MTTASASRALREIGIPANLLGYTYLREALLIVDKDFTLVTHKEVTKKLYPLIADKYGVTSSRVERAIRHAIQVAWERIDLNAVEKYFGNSVNPRKGNPSNSEFIANIVDWFHTNEESIS